MARTKFKAKQLLQMDPYSIKKAAQGAGADDLAAAKDIFRALKNSLDSRIRTYAKHGAADQLPAHIRDIGGVKGKSKSELIKSIREMSSFMRNPERGTYHQWQKEKERRRKALSDRVGYDFKDEDEEKEFGDFMNDMRERYGSGEMWKDVSNAATDLFAEGKRLNLDPKQFLRNFDYWIEHVDDLKNASPIKSGGKIYPSDYARKMNLPKIGRSHGRRRG